MAPGWRLAARLVIFTQSPERLVSGPRCGRKCGQHGGKWAWRGLAGLQKGQPGPARDTPYKNPSRPHYCQILISPGKLASCTHSKVMFAKFRPRTQWPTEYSGRGRAPAGADLTWRGSAGRPARLSRVLPTAQSMSPPRSHAPCTCQERSLRLLPALPFLTAHTPGNVRQGLAFRTQDPVWRSLPPGGEGRGPPRPYDTFRGPHEDRFAWKRFQNPPGAQQTCSRIKWQGTPTFVVSLREASRQRHLPARVSYKLTWPARRRFLG